MPETIALSESALALLRLHVQRQGRIEVGDPKKINYLDEMAGDRE